MSEAEYVLTYFENVRGRLEPVKLMFEDKEVKYDLIQMGFKEWMEEKSKYEFGQLPQLEEITEKHIKVVQSHAIYRFVAKRLNLYGKNEEENIRCEVVISLFESSTLELKGTKFKPLALKPNLCTTYKLIK